MKNCYTVSCGALVSGAILSIVTALLYFFLGVPYLTLAVWIVIALCALSLIGTTALIVLGIFSPRRAIRGCMCKHSFGSLLFNSLAILLGIVIIVSGLAAAIASIATTILLFLFIFAALAGFITFILLINCMRVQTCCRCDCDED